MRTSPAGVEGGDGGGGGVRWLCVYRLTPIFGRTPSRERYSRTAKTSQRAQQSIRIIYLHT